MTPHLAARKITDARSPVTDENPDLTSTPHEGSSGPAFGDTAEALEELFEIAEFHVEGGTLSEYIEDAGEVGRVASSLGRLKHAARGAMLTLAAYKLQHPSQDIRYSKAEHPGGFSARRVDTFATVPFLEKHSLPKSVETHWLSQTLSFAEPWTRSVSLKTQPKGVGPALIDLVNLLEELPPSEQLEAAESIAVIILGCLIEARNRGRVACQRPRALTVGATTKLLEQLMGQSYKSGAPRLPQIIVYAVYAAHLKAGIGRYTGMSLEPLGRMKAADRKAGTAGDIVVSDGLRPFEAVETKLGLPITEIMVAEAIDKVKHQTVKRYLILSTVGVAAAERAAVDARIIGFRKSNGCELIVSGVIDTVGYYLCLLPSTDDFIDEFVEILETDVDLDYEHRVAWNQLCEQL